VPKNGLKMMIVVISRVTAVAPLINQY